MWLGIKFCTGDDFPSDAPTSSPGLLLMAAGQDKGKVVSGSWRRGTRLLNTPAAPAPSLIPAGVQSHAPPESKPAHWPRHRGSQSVLVVTGGPSSGGTLKSLIRGISGLGCDLHLQTLPALTPFLLSNSRSGHRSVHFLLDSHRKWGESP